jgi:uncharacterized protein YjbJ (UPF0337 family)
MNIIKGNLMQLIGNAQLEWGIITMNTSDITRGSRKVLNGKIQECYDNSKDKFTSIKQWDELV